MSISANIKNIVIYAFQGCCFTSISKPINNYCFMSSRGCKLVDKAGPQESHATSDKKYLAKNNFKIIVNFNPLKK